MSYTKFDNSLALAMLDQALKDPSIKQVLADIATRLRHDVLFALMTQEQSGSLPNLRSLAMQHGSGDKFVGALLPDYSQEYLEKTKQGRWLLLESIDKCFQEADKISTSHEFLALMKSIDGMAFIYDEFEISKKNPIHLQCKDYISPTPEETSIRALRTENLLAITYGIETKIGTDLIRKKEPSVGCLSGKARFFILPTTNRPKIWFEKLADQSSFNKPCLPLVASPSNATAKNFIMAQGLKFFNDEQDLFVLAKAQIFANCIMAYLVYCGHHSFLEVAEIWNRQLDFLLIEKPKQLPTDTTTPGSTKLPYMNDPNVVEKKLPYAKIGDYASFLHTSYADSVMERAQNYSKNEVDYRFNSNLNYLK